MWIINYEKNYAYDCVGIKGYSKGEYPKDESSYFVIGILLGGAEVVLLNTQDEDEFVSFLETAFSKASNRLAREAQWIV